MARKISEVSKVLQIGKGWFPEESGGLNRYFYDCNDALSRAGYPTYGLVAGSGQVSISSKGQIQAFAPSQASLLARWQGVRTAFKQQLETERFSLVVSHFSLYTFPILNLLDDLPLVVHFHGPWALESQAEGANIFAIKIKKWIEQSCYQRAQTFIVLSEAFRQVLHQSYSIPLERIQVVPGGVDLARFNTGLTITEVRQKLGWPDDRPIIVAVRRLAKRMGLENLVQALALVKQHYPDVLLYIAGKGYLQETLLRQIQDLDLTANVQLLGYVPDEQLPLMYRAANFSIVPTVTLEGFGLIVVESLAAGTPVLGTPVGGIPEILQPFSEGLVLDGTTPQDLAQGIIEVLSGQRPLPSVQSCQQYVQQHFTWPVIAKRLQSIYSHWD